MLPVPYKKLTLSPVPRRTFWKLTICHLDYLTQLTRKDEIEMEPCIIGLLGKKNYTSRPYIWHCTEAKICEKIKMLKPKSPWKRKCSFNHFNSLFFFAPIQFKITTGSNSRGVRPTLHVSWNKSERWTKDWICPQVTASLPGCQNRWVLLTWAKFAEILPWSLIASFQMPFKKIIITPFIHVTFCFLICLEEMLVVFKKNCIPICPHGQMSFLLVASHIDGLGFFLESK